MMKILSLKIHMKLCVEVDRVERTRCLRGTRKEAYSEVGPSKQIS